MNQIYNIKQRQNNKNEIQLSVKKNKDRKQ